MESTSPQHTPLRVLGIVPARGGSKRLPRKNLCDLGGRPLVAWALDAAARAARLDHWVLSSEDDEILAVGEGRYPGCGLRRPAELAGDRSQAIDYVQHALAEVERSRPRFDAVAIIQPTSPFTEPTDIDLTVDLLERTGADSAVTVVKVSHDLHPAKFKTLKGDRLLPYVEDEKGRMAYQDLPDVYVRSGSVYLSRRSTLERNDLLGADTRGLVTPRERAVDINEPIDLEWARWLLRRRLEQEDQRLSAHLGEM